MVNRKRTDISFLLICIAVILAVNVLSSSYYGRIDFTAEKRYTLSPVTKNILQKLKGNIQVTVYLDGDFPAGFKHLRNATRDVLSDFKAYAGGNFRYAFVNPSQGDEATQQATYEELISKGLEPTNLSVKTENGLSQKIIFPAALVTYNGRQIPVKLLQNRMGATPDEVLNNSIENLEYAFASAIVKVSSGGKPRVGFTEGNGELTDLQLSDAMRTLEDGYEVGRVDLRQITFEGLDKLKLLIIPKPDREFSEAEKYKLNYFVMRGGRVLWAIDQVNAEMDSLQGHGAQQLTFPKKLNLDDILFKYGVRISYNLIADMNCAQIPVNVGSVGGQPQIQLVPWLFYPIFMPTAQHPLVRNLDGIRSEFASTIDTIAVKGIRKQVILSSSPYSRILNAPGMISLKMIEQEPDPNDFKSVPLPTGVLLEGNFPSDFKNRPVPDGIPQQVSLPDTSKFTRMIVLSDGDILKNQVNAKDNSPFPLGYDRYTQQQYGNKALLLNIVDYLTDDSGIISLRNKEVKLRLLDRAKVRAEKLKWQLINVLFPLLLVVLCGVLQQYYRRRKYG
ncbi:gliding motility-associated ABC transporter substrate-binding protein GldG [Pedobacter sp. BS3]|uniref:gliding motility-associated ABC transporter substrate-binding protein GldG n=1 Tax=Pedobacter sp. BS3 TaxID=2567937 RepID=UPI0011EE87CB|nr:gliding motility-associated ABC transporter substrate-binding protein GldG [Pedobacter sp. BS3]TZF82181.1 gliding motility-associated ABC transporter substrate-binding protein GldG [Pedobacter sp. BS3]